jgi:ketosteroid isomerase-like protein
VADAPIRGRRRFSMKTATLAIHEMIEPWNRAVINRNWDAMSDMCTADMVFMPPGGHSVAGPAIRPWLDEFPTVKSMSWDVDDVQEEGALAVARGSVRQTFEVDGEEVLFVGKYCDVLRRGDDGRWRFSEIIWNANEA